MKNKKTIGLAFLVAFAMFAIWYFSQDEWVLSSAGKSDSIGVVILKDGNSKFIVFNQIPNEFYSLLYKKDDPSIIKISPGANPDSIVDDPVIEVPDTLPVAHWNLNKQDDEFIAYDSGSRKLDGTLEYYTSYADGDTAVLFSSVASVIKLPTFNTNAKNELTITAWIWIHGYNNDARIISKATGVQESEHSWMISTYEDRKLRVRLKTDANGTTTLICPVATLTNNYWYHVAMVYNGQTLKIYQDGVEIAWQVKHGNIVEDNNAGVAIGNQPIGAGTRTWNGMIDDVRIYSYALTENQIIDVINGRE